MRFRKPLFLAGATCALALLPTALGAFLANPLMDRYHGGTGHGLFRLIRDVAGKELDSVHEDITHAALSCAEDPRNAGKDPAGAEPICSDTVVAERRRGMPGNWGNPLIRGVWWNDDPNQLFYVVGYPTWIIWMNDAKRIALEDRNLPSESRRINSTYKMQYRSHYGDLQFLHAQANDAGEAPSVTQGKILGWMEFAYRVAIGEIPPERLLGEIDLSLVRASFERQPGWTVNRLLAPKYRLNRDSIRDVALGSMLHVVQDSFAVGHNRRAYDAVGNCPHGRIVQFTSYLVQDPDRHAEQDTRAALLENMRSRYSRLHNPVEASARLIMLARGRADWTTQVEPYLRNNLFCVGPDAEASGAGETG